MGADGEIVVLNDDVANRRRGKVEAQRLPMVPVVEGNIGGALRPGEEQAFALGILTNSVDVLVIGNAGDNLSPGLAAVTSAKNMRAQVVKAQGVDSRISRIGVAVAGFEDRDFLPCAETSGSDIVPVRAAVGGEPDESVVGSGPYAADVERRWCERVDDAALRRRHLAGENADAGGDVPCFACEIGADLLPGSATVVGRPEGIGGEVKQVWIDR